jgi:hypothetical protein
MKLGRNWFVGWVVRMRWNPRSFVYLVFCFGLFAQPGWSTPDDSCGCPKIDCDPCLEEQGLTFYSEKCGPDGSKVKSCARPTCVPMANPPASCNKPQVNNSTGGNVAAKTAIKPAERGPEIGQIKNLEGAAWLKMPDGTRLVVSIGMKVFERDTLETEGNGKVQLEFKDGNLVQVQNDSMVKIDQYEMAADKRNAVINLLRGQVRNQVKQKYNGQTSQYQIRTKTAVAGVRGTDFVASFRESEKVETEIKTLEGKVVLANEDFSQSLEIGKGEQASFVVAANQVFDQTEMNEFVARGYMTPVYKMTAAEIRKLDGSTMLKDGGRQIASVHKNICTEPKADLNSCSWTCVNNPKGEKACRTDMADVSCVRRRCNANGEWAEETRLPAAMRQECKPAGTKVAPCDY